MNINCIICSDMFLPTSKIYVTNCGHVFHNMCLMQWIERSKTCPQCRHNTTKDDTHRIYLNILNSEAIPEEIKLVIKANKALELKVSSMTSEAHRYKTQNFLLKTQVRTYMHKNREQAKFITRVQSENRKLKNKLQAIELETTTETKLKGLKRSKSIIS